MTKRVVLFAFIMLSIATLIGRVFWIQELQYALPTPVPAKFVDVRAGETVDLSDQISMDNRPVLLHFFNADCPCSRFNMKDFESLAHDYKGKVNFFAVIQSKDHNAVDEFKKKYELNIPTILDKEGIISERCGIYATPQAVILDKNSTIYFKGNYNKARFCTRKETKFVDIALSSLLKNEPLPLSVKNALTEPYGCSLPSNGVDDKDQTILSLF
jgi:peroxiredoxin